MDDNRESPLRVKHDRVPKMCGCEGSAYGRRCKHRQLSEILKEATLMPQDMFSSATEATKVQTLPHPEGRVTRNKQVKCKSSKSMGPSMATAQLHVNQMSTGKGGTSIRAKGQKKHAAIKMMFTITWDTKRILKLKKPGGHCIRYKSNATEKLRIKSVGTINQRY